MEMKNKLWPYDPKWVVQGAIAPDFEKANPNLKGYNRFCMGYLNPGASGDGYIAALKLSVGTVPVKDLDDGTEGIVSYDRAEKNDAYIGQINMLTASSFSGLNGAVWGYHLARPSAGFGDLKYHETYGGQNIPVYDSKALLDAAQLLFGTEEERHFPPMPGAHVICANKSVTKPGPLWVWSSMALAMVDREKTPTQGSNLFIEDTNTWKGAADDEAGMEAFLEETLHKVTRCVAMCGEDQNVTYDRIFAGYKYAYAESDQVVGCALTAAPYIQLARDAVPDIEHPEALVDMTLEDWWAAVQSRVGG